MELNQTTENINFTSEQGGVSKHIFNSTRAIILKLIKNKNGFFTNYQPIEKTKAIAENQNIVAIYDAMIKHNKVESILFRTITIPNKPPFSILLLTDGRVIDSRRIKLKENEVIEGFRVGSTIKIYMVNIKINKYTRIIEITLD